MFIFEASLTFLINITLNYFRSRNETASDRACFIYIHIGCKKFWKTVRSLFLPHLFIVNLTR